MKSKIKLFILILLLTGGAFSQQDSIKNRKIFYYLGGNLGTGSGANYSGMIMFLNTGIQFNFGENTESLYTYNLTLIQRLIKEDDVSLIGYLKNIEYAYFSASYFLQEAGFGFEINTSRRLFVWHLTAGYIFDYKNKLASLAGGISLYIKL